MFLPNHSHGYLSMSQTLTELGMYTAATTCIKKEQWSDKSFIGLLT